MSRRDELGENLGLVQERVAGACRAVGREPDEVTVVAVTKTFPADDVRLLAGLGVTDVGENRDQEAHPKWAACADLRLRWHFVGQLQTNKCRSVVRYADVVHSVDRLSLVAALSEAAVRVEREVTALVQVAVDPPGGAVPQGRAGVPPEVAVDLAGAVSAAPGLLLGGVMAVAPLGGDPDVAFAALARTAAAVRAAHPTAVAISAGMSGDLEAAIRHGATHVRIGTALLGHRASPVG